jgi:hypothetical protein
MALNQPEAGLHRHVGTRLPAILKVAAVDVLVRVVVDRRAGAVGPEGVAFEQDVCRAGRAWRTIVELDRGDIAALAIPQKRVQLHARLEVVHPPAAHRKADGRIEIQHRTIRDVGLSEVAFLSNRRQAARDVPGRIGLDDVAGAMAPCGSEFCGLLIMSLPMNWNSRCDRITHV